MALATYIPKAGLRLWLRDELNTWAESHFANLRLKDVREAVGRIPSASQTRDSADSAAPLLKAATAVCFEADERLDSVDQLGALYAATAQLVYELEFGA